MKRASVFDPRRRRVGAFRNITVFLLLIVLLPALFYSAYEITTLSEQEDLIGDIYRRQLDAILFSINQYAWDVVNTWMGDLNVNVRNVSPGDTARLTQQLNFYLNNQPTIYAVLVTDSSIGDLHLVTRNAESGTSSPNMPDIRRSLLAVRNKLDRVFRYRELSYRKIESAAIDINSGEYIALVTVGTRSTGPPLLVGIIIEKETYVRRVLAPKLIDAAGEEFILNVTRGTEKAIFSTDSLGASISTQTKDLWLFPDYRLGIRTKGESLDEIVRERFQRNLGLIIILDVILLLGGWFVYRNIRREMELVRLKSDFVSSVSHELRTPLSLIRMFAETLEMGRLSKEEKKREYYATILRETERLTRLVNNILNFSRMEAGKKQYHFNPIDFNSVVADVLETFSHQLTEEGFVPEVTYGERIPTFHADRESVSEALINLIDNAMKYSPDRKYLRIATGTADGTAWIEVEDRGIGIAPEHQGKIYETFYRVSTGLVQTTRGTGIGLALVRHIMDAHGGTVTLSSRPGEGSTFRLSFPLKRTEHDKA